MAQVFEGRVDKVDEKDVKLDGVLLFPQVDRLALHAEMLPETPGDVKLQLGRRQVAENGLDLLQDRHVVRLPRLLEIITIGCRSIT